MTLLQYERKFCDELIDNYDGSVRWSEYVRECYQEHMDSVDEQKIVEWENRQ